ncbi:NifU family protein [Hugenholtzia roseola]|uniref:NifU family protein n=1 Tax=Hugenholtzia roseola TaxID=1002 RepID=UPI000412094C|nr:NifU family protein [Hugenholtzia roseola]
MSAPTSQSPYVHIYVEENPNPNSLKFVLSFFIVPEDVVKDYENPTQAEESPLAVALFEQFGFVKRVFYAKNFITLTKDADTVWTEVLAQVRQFLKEYFEAQKPVFIEEMPEMEIQIQEDPTIRRIKDILDQYIKPAVEMDGGAIVFSDFDAAAGVLKVRLQGSCSGCPSSMITLKAGIQNLFQRMMPEVKEVVAEN